MQLPTDELQLQEVIQRSTQFERLMSFEQQLELEMLSMQHRLGFMQRRKHAATVEQSMEDNIITANNITMLQKTVARRETRIQKQREECQRIAVQNSAARKNREAKEFLK